MLIGTARIIQAQTPLSYSQTPIRQIISDIENASEYRFLYRDALITGKTVTFNSNQGDLIEDFDSALRNHKLQLKIETSHKQILLIKANSPTPESPRNIVINGFVMDAESGTRLPFATLTWYDQDRLRGVAANEAGVFQFSPATRQRPDESLEITVSYVGYHPERVRITANQSISELSVRLRPQQRTGPEIVISSSALQSNLDTTFHHLLQPGLFSPLGENNVLRALQPLPSVSLTPALAQGLNVRGSKSDGFQVLLDGAPIYNQNHFFGLFDAFNEDALQRVGFFYGIAPAQFQATPGGTLSFVTRTGDQHHFRQTFGLSNSTVKGTFEGPLLDGRGSWLISGRRSYLNAVDWFNNSDLIAQGLSVGRDNSATSGNASNGLLMLNVDRGVASADFYDLHGKVHFESESGNRLMVSGYMGGDRTLQEAFINVLPADLPGMPLPPLKAEPAHTRNNWNNEALSIHFQQSAGSQGYLHSLLALSQYRGRYAKDDFIYRIHRDNRNQPGPQQPRDSTFQGLFSYNNDLREWRWSQHMDLLLPQIGTGSVGYSLQRYSIDYSESTEVRTAFGQILESNQFDLFSQLDLSSLEWANLNLGLRSHYFTRGNYFRLSPRFWAHIRPQSRVSFGLGFSQNHQFLHRLSLENTASADIWVMSSARQEPTKVNNLTGGIYMRPSQRSFIQLETYFKHYTNLWEHAVNSQGRPVQNLDLRIPWYFDNTADAVGLEVLMSHRLGSLLLTNSYTLSRIDLQNDAINKGQAFPASWDRRHQFTSYVQGPIGADVSWYLSWLFATGTPNIYADQTLSESDRIGNYHRLDLSLQYHKKFKSFGLEAHVSFFNLYNRDNPWYRSPIPVRNRNQPGQNQNFVLADVFDLGFQPSFDLSFTF